MVDVSIGWAFPACGWAATVHDAPWSFTSSSSWFMGWVYEWNIREHIIELIRRSSTATKLLIPQHHQKTCASQCSIFDHHPLGRRKPASLATGATIGYWIERIQTQNHQLVYTAPENWLLIHHFGNDWGYIQDDANGLQESPVFFDVERPGRALIFDGNPIPITLYSWWLSHVQSPHYLVGFIGVRLSDSESWTSECPHEGTLCRPASLYIASCVWHVELPNLRTNI